MLYIALVILIVVTVSPMFAQADWGAIGALRPGQRIDVTTREGSFLTGRFERWTPSEFELLNKRKRMRFASEDVDRVHTYVKASRWKAALIGAAVGFALAFPIGAASAGYVADTNHPRFGTRVEVGAACGIFGAGLGAGIGAITGGAKRIRVYARSRR